MREIDLSYWISTGNKPMYNENISYNNDVFKVLRYMPETNEIETKDGIILPITECKILLTENKNIL